MSDGSERHDATTLMQPIAEFPPTENEYEVELLNLNQQTESHDSTTRSEPAPYIPLKGILDRTSAALLLVPGIPVIGLLVVLTKLSSHGPGIYRQSRVGRNGTGFTVYKIRTMRNDAESKSGPVWCIKNDSRITFLGRIMRKLHLDELPQLFNVLKGEMSLIGPRPERPVFVDKLVKEIPDYHARLAINPGITGLAQINLLPDATLNDAKKKQCLDLEYIETVSLHLDLRILACTALRIIGIRGPSINHFLRVNRVVNLPTELEESDSPAQANDPFTPSEVQNGYEQIGFVDPELAAIHAAKWLEKQGLRARALTVDSLEQLVDEAASEFEDGEGVVVLVARATRTKTDPLVAPKPR